MLLRFPDPPEGWTVSDGGLENNDPVAALKLVRPDASAFVPLLEKALKPQDRQAREATLAQAGRAQVSIIYLKTPQDWVRAAALKALCAMATWSDPSRPELAGARPAPESRRPRSARIGPSPGDHTRADRAQRTAGGQSLYVRYPSCVNTEITIAAISTMPSPIRSCITPR